MSVQSNTFFASGDLNPLELLGKRLSDLRKINFGRKFSSFPAERERRSTPGRRRRAGSGPRSGQHGPADSEGRTGGSNGTGSGCQAQWRTGRRTEWPTGGGGPEGGRGGTVPHGPSPVSSFASFWGASAGRGRRTSGVDGADIGRGVYRVKEYYLKKGNIFEYRPGSRHFAGESRGITLRKGPGHRKFVLPPLQRGKWPSAARSMGVPCLQGRAGATAPPPDLLL